MAQPRFEVVFVDGSGFEARRIVTAPDAATAAAGVELEGVGIRVLRCTPLSSDAPPPWASAVSTPGPSPLASSPFAPPPPPPAAASADNDRMLAGLRSLRRSPADESWIIAAGVAKGVLTAVAFIFFGAAVLFVVLAAVASFLPSMLGSRDALAASVGSVMIFGMWAVIALVEGLLLLGIGSWAQSTLLRRVTSRS